MVLFLAVHSRSCSVVIMCSRGFLFFLPPYGGYLAEVPSDYFFSVLMLDTYFEVPLSTDSLFTCVHSMKLNRLNIN